QGLNLVAHRLGHRPHELRKIRLIVADEKALVSHRPFTPSTPSGSDRPSRLRPGTNLDPSIFGSQAGTGRALRTGRWYRRWPLPLKKNQSKCIIRWFIQIQM